MRIKNKIVVLPKEVAEGYPNSDWAYEIARVEVFSGCKGYPVFDAPIHNFGEKHGQRLQEIAERKGKK